MSTVNAPPLIMLNPHAGSGKASHVWDQLRPLLRERLGDLSAVTTHHPHDIEPHLRAAAEQGIDRVIAIGGDGTNHSVINEIIHLNQRQAHLPIRSYGNVPIGTGRDWARGLGIPINNLSLMADWIVDAKPQPVDIGTLTYRDGHTEYFLNIASAGLGGDVATRVDRMGTRRPWTFYAATVESILAYKPRALRVKLDGQEWYEGGVYLVAVANGTTFGRGMRIAPNAIVDDGMFDVILVKAVSRRTILTAFQRVYSGTHLSHPAVRHARAKRVEIDLLDAVDENDCIKMELDGEYREGRSLTFEVRHRMLQFLR